MLRLSIIIPTYCRPSLLRWGLISLQKQTLNFSYEIIILNDGEENDGTKEVTEEFSDNLNIRYIYSRQKNEPLQFRIPGFAINIGARLARGRNLIIMSPEMFILNGKIEEMMDILDANSNLMVVPGAGINDNGEVLKLLEQTNMVTYEQLKFASWSLNTKLPFFMAITKQKYMEINGYDEEFIGYCFDDNDFVSRLQNIGCQYYATDMKVIHLYHSRKDRKGLDKKQARYAYNQQLFNQKQRFQKPIQIIPVKKWELNKIPKIAHFYWGEAVLPYMRYLTIYTFIKQNPDWKIKYYYPKIICKNKTWHSFELKYDISQLRDYTSELKKLSIEMIELDFSQYLISNDISEVFKSDLLRWYLLSNEGGLWSDMDILYFRPMTSLFDNNKENNETDTTVTINNTYGHSIGFLMSAPNNSYYTHTLNCVHKYYNPKEYQSLGTGILLKETKNMSDIIAKFPKLKIVNIDNNAVYSYNASMIKLIYTSESLRYFNSNSIGLHWYAGHVLSGQFSSKITEKNYDESNFVINAVMKLCLNSSINEINFLLKEEQNGKNI